MTNGLKTDLRGLAATVPGLRINRLDSTHWLLLVAGKPIICRSDPGVVHFETPLPAVTVTPDLTARALAWNNTPYLLKFAVADSGELRATVSLPARDATPRCVREALMSLAVIHLGGLDEVLGAAQVRGDETDEPSRARPDRRTISGGRPIGFALPHAC